MCFTRCHPCYAARLFAEDPSPPTLSFFTAAGDRQGSLGWATLDSLCVEGSSNDATGGMEHDGTSGTTICRGVLGLSTDSQHLGMQIFPRSGLSGGQLILAVDPLRRS